MKTVKPKQYKPKKCKQCKEPFTPDRPIQPVCGYICALAYAKDRIAKKLRSDNKVKLRDMMTLPEHKKELEFVINQIVKFIDMGVNCISTGQKLTGFRNSGHYRSVKAWPSLRFNLINIHNQSIRGNKYEGGMPMEYLEGVIKMYGQEYADEMTGLALKYPQLHITIPEVKEARAKALKILARLKKENRTYSVQERIELRRAINEEIGIYK